jgi:PST family polysaccharide transporter
VRSMARACFRPALGGALMAVASLLVSRLAGGGVGGLAAAMAAGAAIYLPVVYPLRALLQRSPERRAREGVGDPADSGATTGYFNLGNPGS